MIELTLWQRIRDFIVDLFTPTPPPRTLIGALALFDKLITDRTNLEFYIENLNEEFSPAKEFYDYMVKSEFNTSSARDELKIYINNIRTLAELDAINARIAKDQANVK